MRVQFSIVLFAVAALYGAGALAACPPGQAGSGCVSFDGLSDITQQIVAKEPLPVVKAAAPPTSTVTTKPYTGPTVGLTNTVKRAPTVGYHWSLE